MVEPRSSDEGEGPAGSFDPPPSFGDEGFADWDDGEIQAALDAWEPPPHLRDRPLPSRLSAWRRSSLLGAMAAGIPLGLREVLDPPKDEPIVIEVDADGEPHDLPIRLLLDPDDPSGSLCIVRRDPPPPIV